LLTDPSFVIKLKKSLPCNLLFVLLTELSYLDAVGARDSVDAQLERVLRARGYQEDPGGLLVGACPWCGDGLLRWHREKGVFHNTCANHHPGGGTKELASLLVGIRLSEVTAEHVESVFGGRIHLGKINLIDGDPGLGKTLLALDLAARMSAGLPMPDGTPCEAAGVVILSAEDGLSDTLQPRLQAAGAELSRIVAIRTIPDPDGDRFPEIPRDLSAIEDAIVQMSARLVIIDPLVAYLGAQTNSFRDQDVRRALAPLAEMAERRRVAVIAVRHLNKREDAKAIYRGGGSIAFAGAARSALLVASDPQDTEKRVLASVKNNLAAQPASLAYRVVPSGSSIRIEWLGTSSHTAQSVLAVPSKTATAVAFAVSTLRTILANGPVTAEDAKAEAQRRGIAPRTLDRAKQELGVQSYKEGFGAESLWFWKLPSPDEGSDAINGGLGALCENSPPESFQVIEISKERQGPQRTPNENNGGELGEVRDGVDPN
jgi:archaellum biogenesis ATPase FlaH